MLLGLSVPASLCRVSGPVSPLPSDATVVAPARRWHSTPAPGSARFGIRVRRAPRVESPLPSASTAPPLPQRVRAPPLRTEVAPPAVFRARRPGRGPPAWERLFFFQAEDGIRDLIVTGV